MGTYFTSDNHYNHVNILKYCGRPFKDVNHMNETMISNWNNVVKTEDVVFHLGDFSFQSDRFVHRLNGKIMLIRGNHDKKRYDDLFHDVVNGMPLMIGEFNCFLRHKPILSDIEPDLYSKYDYFICGHVHEKWKVSGKNINVGVDQWDFKLIYINNLIELIETI